MQAKHLQVELRHEIEAVKELTAAKEDLQTQKKAVEESLASAEENLKIQKDTAEEKLAELEAEKQSLILKLDDITLKQSNAEQELSEARSKERVVEEK